MQKRRKVSKAAVIAALAAVMSLSIAACGSDDDDGGGGGGGGDEGGGGGSVALLLPESKTARYESQDRPNFERKLGELCPDCDIIYSNADQDPAKQQQQAEAAITKGAKVLVLDPVDAASAASIVTRAKQSQIPVVSYDRLITDADIDYYISFDNEQVGKLQGESLTKKLEEDGASGDLVMINGAPTDNNAKLFAEGAHSVIDASEFKVAKEYDTPDWSPDKAQQEMEQAITALGKDGFVGVYAANDGTAGGAIAAMKGNGIDPKTIPTTGQDAELAAIQRILAGEQYMTVYKAIKAEAEAAAELAAALAKGETPPSGPRQRQDRQRPEAGASRSCSSRWRSRWTTSRTPSSRTGSGSPARSARASTLPRARKPASSNRGLGARPRSRVAGRRRPRERSLDMNANGNTPVLALRGVSKSFGAVKALTDIDFEVHDGEVVALVGDNGAGKSTMVKTIAGHPQRRRWSDPLRRRGGEDQQSHRRHRPRNSHRLPGPRPVRQPRRGREPLPRARGGSGPARQLNETAMEKRANDLLSRLAVTITDVRAEVGMMSGGQRQQVAIARSLLGEPKVVMLDEPTAALGVRQTAMVLSLIKRLREEGHGVVVISHNLADVFEVADRIFVLRLGQKAGDYAVGEASTEQIVGAITGASDKPTDGAGGEK